MRGTTYIFREGWQGRQIHYRPAVKLVLDETGLPIYWAADVKFEFPILGAKIKAVHLKGDRWYYELVDADQKVVRRGTFVEVFPKSSRESMRRIRIAKRLWSIVQAHFRTYRAEFTEDSDSTWAEYYSGPHFGPKGSTGLLSENVYGEAV